jgi:hypothetical protein
MVKPNYAFAKRQRDLAKKQKSAAKRERKSEIVPTPPEGDPELSPTVEKPVS